MKPVRQSKPRGVSGTAWAKCLAGYWDALRNKESRRGGAR